MSQLLSTPQGIWSVSTSAPLVQVAHHSCVQALSGSRCGEQLRGCGSTGWNGAQTTWQPEAACSCRDAEEEGSAQPIFPHSARAARVFGRPLGGCFGGKLSALHQRCSTRGSTQDWSITAVDSGVTKPKVFRARLPGRDRVWPTETQLWSPQKKLSQENTH